MAITSVRQIVCELTVPPAICPGQLNRRNTQCPASLISAFDFANVCWRGFHMRTAPERQASFYRLMPVRSVYQPHKSLLVHHFAHRYLMETMMSVFFRNFSRAGVSTICPTVPVSLENHVASHANAAFALNCLPGTQGRGGLRRAGRGRKVGPRDCCDIVQ